MKLLFKETSFLDKRCYEEFALSEDILMEHAADGMADYVCAKFQKKSSVLVVCGAGNNGADGIALARLLHKEYDVKIYLAFGVKSEMAKLQLQRAQLVGVEFVEELIEADIVVDALFGSGLSRSFDEKTESVIEKLNAFKAFKIACDLPSGLKDEGSCERVTFKADVTLSMGALKLNAFLDEAKDYVGELRVLDLGITRSVYELPSKYKLLEEGDLVLPHRDRQDSHKGSFGHLAVLCGEKVGAAVIASEAALHFGAGLVTLVSNENVQIPYEIMLSHSLPSNTTAIALGMGLGVEFSNEELEKILSNNLPLVLDADIFYHEMILELLKRKNIVITPHPKEFVELLRVTKIATINISELQANRFKYVEMFTEIFKDTTLLLKGANVIIASEGEVFVNPLGSSRLAKGGSGDVLSGLIASLLAQGYDAKSATINASLAHTLALKHSMKNSYAYTPSDIIEGVCKL